MSGIPLVCLLIILLHIFYAKKDDTDKVACELVSKPIDHNKRLKMTKEDTQIDKEIYHTLIRRLIFLSYTISNTTYVISVIK